MISTLTLANQLAAKRSRWRCRNGQKPKTRRPFKSDSPPRFCTRPTPHPAALAPPNIPDHHPYTVDWSLRELQPQRASRYGRPLAARQSSSTTQRCGGKQPAHSPRAGLGGQFGRRLQLRGAQEAPRARFGRGDEQTGRGVARATRQRRRGARRQPRAPARRGGSKALGSREHPWGRMGPPR